MVTARLSEALGIPWLETNYNVSPASGDFSVARGQAEDDILHMVSYIRYPDRCSSRIYSLAGATQVLNQELQLWPRPSVFWKKHQ